MKKSICLTLIVLYISFAGFSQKTPDANTARNIESLKIAFVTKQLSLTPEEAQKFWPVFNNYAAELKKARQERKVDNDILLFEENVLNIRKNYKPEFKKILIADDRVNKVLTSDRDFMNVLKKELQLRTEMRNKQ